VTEFFDVISQSVPHVYHSALQLTPKSSIVWKLYGKKTYSPVVRVVTGVPTSWDLCTATTGSGGFTHCVIWFPCGQFIAVSYDMEIQVLDVNTLGRVSTLKFPDNLSDITPVSLTVSPNGHLLACSCCV